jgi:hypothetical protein
MRVLRFVRVFAAAMVLATAVLVLRPAGAQNAAPGGTPTCIGCSADGKTTPRTDDGHPDLSGFWDNPFVPYSLRSDDGSLLFDFGQGPRPAAYGVTGHEPGEQVTQPVYKPEFAAKVKAIVDGQYGASTPLDPQYDCKPLGVPRAMESPFQIIQTPPMTAILYESPDKIGQTFRVIYTDGRAQPKPEDLDTSYLGHSVGHWEGDVLAVDVIGLSDETWLGGGQTGEKYAILHSEKEHVVERYSRNGDLLTYEATVNDPVMFAQPWVLTPRRFVHAKADDEILENFCSAKDKEHIIAPSEKDHFICNYCVPDKH